MPSSGMKLSTGSFFTDTGTSGTALSSDEERFSFSIFTSILVWLATWTGISTIRGFVYTWSNLMSSLMASSLADGDPKEGDRAVGTEFVSPEMSSSSFSRHVDSESAYLRNISGSRLSRKPNRRSDCKMKDSFRKTVHYSYSQTPNVASINPHVEVKIHWCNHNCFTKSVKQRLRQLLTLQKFTQCNQVGRDQSRSHLV